MQTELSGHGVSVVVISKETPEAATIHKKRDGLTFKMLTDANLDVIKQYGVEHHKAVGGDTGTFMILGIPLGPAMHFKTMAIPTTLLIDENGIIRWIDQTDDYRLRSNPEPIFQAVRDAFGS